jgi:hypothetical protein
MNCPHCGGGLADGVDTCPECGAPSQQTGAHSALQGPEPEIAVMLAQANLLRLRREYDRATIQCVEVLRRYPNNASAHSLLGDIYRDQGAVGEALGWYRLASQLDPDSAADRHKLAEMERRLAAPPPAAEAAAAWRRVSTWARSRLPLGLLLGIAAGCLVLGALWTLNVGKEASRAAIVEGEGAPRVLVPPSADIERSRIPEPPVRERAARPNPPPAPPATEQPTITIGGASSPLSPVEETGHADREQRLLRSLRAAAQAEELMLAVDSVVIDPRDGAATLFVMVRDVLASPNQRTTVLQKCLRVAELALASDSRLTRLTLRCSVPLVGADGVQKEEPVFVGEIAASALKDAAGRDLTLDQALKLFAPSPWWHPCMSSAAAPA